MTGVVDPDDLVTVSCGLHGLAARTDAMARHAAALDRPDLVAALTELAAGLRDAGGTFAELASAEQHRRPMPPRRNPTVNDPPAGTTSPGGDLRAFTGLGRARARAALIMTGADPARASAMLAEADREGAASELDGGTVTRAVERDPGTGAYTVRGRFPW